MQSLLHIGARAKKKAWQLRQPIKEAENKTKQDKKKKYGINRIKQLGNANAHGGLLMRAREAES